MSLDTHVDVPWQPLNSSKSEIRVLEISPALSQSDSIICHLQTLSLLDEPEYEALSYVWGISSESRKIILNGKALIVTDNLFKALTHLRDVNKTRTLWVDAVCINQKDDIEKNVQVMMMDKIYSKASRVLVWLMENDSYLISDHIASFSRDQNRHLTKYPLSLWALSKIDWWRRAWTFQEAALANNLVFYIGEEYFTIEHFEAYRHSMYQHLFRPNACCSHILRQGPLHPKEYGTALEALQQLLKIRKLLSKGKQDLLNLITVNKDRLASNPRDKVYAYLGLACDAPAELVKYELPLKECIIYITTKLIQHNMSLEAIRHASPSGIFGDDEERMAELPSWCPDWTRSTKRRISFTTQSQFDRLYQRFSASSHTKAKIFFPTAEILGVSGVLCDTVTHVGHGEPGIWGPGSDPKILLQWCYLAAHSTSVHNARCDECDKIIYGVRNKCLSCSDFDLCSRCFRISGNIHPGHTFTCIQSSSLMLKDNSNNQDMYKAPDIVITERENGYHVQGSSWETLSEMDYPFNNSDTMQDAFRKVLISDTPVLTIRSNDMENGSRADPILQDIAFAEYWSRKVEKRPAVAIPAKEGYAEDQVISILSELTNEHIFIVKDTINLVLMGKRMFVSSKGYIGWGPDELMAGDTVAVLNGSSMPFILRAVPEQQTKAGFDSGYTLVGECYAHGLMNGEALEDAEMEKRDILLY